jgi:anhydro-N-acetylmuramic acid kinase
VRAKGRVKTEFLAGRGKSFPAELRQSLLRLAESDRANLSDVIYLDNLIGQFMGRSAAAYIQELSRRGITVDAVASHGQTVRHLPRKVKVGRYSVHGTMQIGSLSQIASLTDRITVGDFRQAEVALGGEGAPITTPAVEVLFADPTQSRLIVNIGGISNYFYFPSKNLRRVTAAEDCGPGNTLCDILSRQLFAEKYDRGGRRAAQGLVSQRLLTLLLGEGFFRDGLTSTGRESFGLKMAEKVMAFGKRFGLTSEDLMATAAELTVAAIAMNVRKLAKADAGLSKLYLTGGGRKNIFFRKRLQQHLPGMKVLKIEVLGMNGDFVEAAAYAVMGEATLRSQPSQVGRRRKRGEHRYPVLGVIVQPPKR